MADLTASATIPDYGWSSADPERSHRYLQTVVVRTLRDIARRSASRSSTLRVFDAGCGNGALLHRLRCEGFEVAGCDASESGVRLARERNAGVQIERLSVYDDMSAAFGAQWDVVVSTEVIEHLFAPRDFVREARRLVRPQGALILTTPYHGYVKNVALALSGALDRHFTALWDGGHIKFWSYRTLCMLLREFDFERFEFHGAGRLPGLWKSMVVVARRSG